MLFFIIVIALALELMVAQSEQIKKIQWLSGYRDWVISLFRKSAVWDGPAGVLAVLALPIMLVAWFQNSSFYTNSLYGLTNIVVGVFFLVYCFRYRSLEKVIDDLSTPADKDVNKFVEYERNAMRELLGQTEPTIQYRYSVLTEAVLVQANERLFAVIFWFLVFGPAGALAYRFSWFLTEYPMDPGVIEPGDDDMDAASYRLSGILSWVPARICAAGYALAGGFEDALSEWSEQSVGERYDFCQSNNRVLGKTGMAALHIHRYESSIEDDDVIDKIVNVDAVKAARALVLRTLLLICTVIASIGLTAWFVVNY